MTPDRDAPGMVKSDSTLFAIVETLQGLEKAGVTELAGELNLAKSTVHKHLKTLHHLGYVVRDDGTYRIGLRFLDVGIRARDGLGFYHAIEPKMKQLAADTGERSSSMVEEGGAAVFIGAIVGQNSVNTSVHLGMRSPLHCTAGGKALMSHLPESRVREILDRKGLSMRTERTITDPDVLLTELEEIREQGYAFSREEWIDGLHAVAAPIRNPDGEVLASIALAGAAYRLTNDRCHGELKDMVLAAANEVELNLTYE